MSAKTVFISYRRDSTGKLFARLLEQELTQQGYDVFLDVDSLASGNWSEQVITQVPLRSHFLLLLTPGSLDRCEDPNDWVRREFELAVKTRRNIVPVREESVDLVVLRNECPESMKGVFDLQIATIQHARFTRDVEELIERYIPPHKAPVDSKPDALAFRTDISRIIKYAPEKLIGRDNELKLLNDAWEKVARAEKGCPHILTFVALGGEGKTSLVAKWAAELAGQAWPGCDAAFAWSFYSQGTREQVAASSDLFLKEALNFFGNESDKEFAAGSAGAFEKGQRLASIVGQRRSLLILDGLEPLQYAPTSPTPGELKDQGVAALLKGLASSSHGLCVVTTRYSIPDLKAFRQTTAPEVELMRLSSAAGVHLLQSFDVKGSLLRNIPLNDGKEKVNEFEKLVEDVKGHALTLNLLGTYLRDAHGGDIRKRDLVKLEEADTEEQGGHAFHVMDAYVKWLGSGGKNEDESEKSRRALALLRLLGLFDRPATADCLAALWNGDSIPKLTEPLVGLTDPQRNIVLKRLEDAKLLTMNRDASGELMSLDAHPLLREYFARQLRTQQPDAWRAAHRRLYEHLCATTKEGDQPKLEDLQPLYQAVAHGCQAGLQQETAEKAFYARIHNGQEGYNHRKLGAFGSDLGAIACFFETPWSLVSAALTEGWKAWLLNEAAYSLRALGRLTEALEPFRAGLKMRIEQKLWQNAARFASNLSELELTLGEVARAVEDAEQSVTYADRGGDADWRGIMRATHADTLHQAGRRTEAEMRFCEAEQMQAEQQPDYPLLFSARGFKYCNLLLAAPERAVWQIILGRAEQPLGLDIGAARQRRPTEREIESCRVVSQRGKKMFEWRVPSDSLLDIALDHLTLGRATFYEAVLKHSDLRLLTSDLFHIDAAVDGLRRAGQQNYLPLGLLTHAWLRFLTSPRTGHESAQEDLDEAWEIAERGPMRLFMADIHLYRARLFHSVQPYPWAKDAAGNERGPKDDLAAARKLIEQCGYWRRKEALEDSEAAAKGW